MSKLNENKLVNSWLSPKKGKPTKKHVVQGAVVARLGESAQDINLSGVEVNEKAAAQIALAEGLTNPEARKALIDAAIATMANQSNLGAVMTHASKLASEQLDPKNNRNH